MKYNSWSTPQSLSSIVPFAKALHNHRKIDNSITKEYTPGFKSQGTQCISFFNYKGGTGKTTSCVSIAGHLAQLGKRVLVVDWDPQANASYSLGVAPEQLKRSMADVVLNQLEGHSGYSIRDVIITTPISNLDLAPTNLRLSETEAVMYKADASSDLLLNALDPVQGYYDFILIDMPSGSNIFMSTGLRAATQLVVPCSAGTYSLQGLRNLKHFLNDIKTETGHVVANFTVVLTRSVESSLIPVIGHRRPATTDEMEDDLAYMFGPIYKVPDSDDILDAQRENMPVTCYAPKCSASKAYIEVADQLIENGEIAGAFGQPGIRPRGYSQRVIA